MAWKTKMQELNCLKYARKHRKFPVPLLLQSHDITNAERAKRVGADFINKNSESLSMDILNFLYQAFGIWQFCF